MPGISETLRRLRGKRVGMGDLVQEVRSLSSRLEFVRRELFFEMKYGRECAGNRDVSVRPRILDRVKVEAARRTVLRLNLGCGHVALPDYVNVDMRELPGVDVVATLDDLPVERDEASEIFSSHVLEHFPLERLRRGLLPYWYSLLAPGGTFRATVPDGEAMVRNMAEGRYAFDDFREVLFGSQDYEGDFHYNMFTPDSMKDLLLACGFVDVDHPARAVRNGRCYEFTVVATKPRLP